jgi:hypothetical protein
VWKPTINHAALPLSVSLENCSRAQATRTGRVGGGRHGDGMLNKPGVSSAAGGDCEALVSCLVST